MTDKRIIVRSPFNISSAFTILMQRHNYIDLHFLCIYSSDCTSMINSFTLIHSSIWFLADNQNSIVFYSCHNHWSKSRSWQIRAKFIAILCWKCILLCSCILEGAERLFSALSFPCVKLFIDQCAVLYTKSTCSMHYS